MYKVASEYKGAVIVAKRPTYPRDGGGRFNLDQCTQKDLQFLYDTLAMTDVVEFHEEPETQVPENNETKEESTTKSRIQRNRRAGTGQ